MSVAGAFFEVTGKRDQLFRIMHGLERTGDRLTADDSMSADLWGEMLDEWFRIHDEGVWNEGWYSATNGKWGPPEPGENPYEEKEAS